MGNEQSCDICEEDAPVGEMGARDWQYGNNYREMREWAQPQDNYAVWCCESWRVAPSELESKRV